MDASSGFFKKFALFAAIVLLVAAPGWAQSLVVSPNPVALTGTTQSVTVNVTASDNSAIPFTVTITSTTTPGFFSVSPASGTTPASLTVQTINVAACSISACNGSFRVRPTSGGGADVNVPVSFTSTGGGGGGGSIISVTPTAQTVNAAIGGQALAQTTIQTSSASSIGFTVQSDSAWLTPSATSGNVSSGAPFTLNATASASVAPANTNGQFTGKLNVTAGGQTATFTVTFVVGTGSGGGGSGLTYTVSQTAVSLSYPTGQQSAFLTISSNSIATYNAGSDQPSWLLVDGFTSVTGIPVSQGVSITLGGGVVNLAANTYTGHVTIYNPNTPFTPDVIITVTLTVGGGGGSGNFNVSPASLAFTATFSGAATAAQTLTVTVPSGTSFTVRPEGLTGVDFLRFNGQSCAGTCTFNGSQNINVTAVPLANMPVGGYNDQLDIASGGTTLHVSISFQITNGAAGPLTFNPTSFNFSSPVNGAAQSQNLQVTTNTGTQWTVSSSASWLTVTNAGITMAGSQTLSVTANPSGLAANTYNGVLTFNSVGGTQQVPVTLVVGSGGGGTSTLAAPTTLSFAYQTNTGFPVGQAVLIAPAGAYSVSTPTQSWINVTPTNGTAPAQISVSVNPAGLTAASTAYTGSFTITTTAGSQSITVSLLVTTSAVLQPSPGDIIYQPPTTTYPLTLTASDFSSQSATATSSNSWVTLSNQSISGTQVTYFVTINPAGLCNGLNVANITVSTSAANNPLVVPVVALISGAATNCGSGGGGTLTANPNTLTFNYQQGNAAPVAQTVSVTSSTGSAVAFSVSSTSQGGWLSASANSTTTPATVTVNVSPGQLQPSSTPYTGTVTLTPSGGAAATNISVSITVTAGASVTASPTTLNFSVQAGAAASTQNVTVSGTTGATFSATASSTGGWLSVTPASGSVPNTLTVSVNPANLTPSSTPYTGTITVAGTGSSTGSTTITVNVTVTAPLPTISKVGNAASFVVGALAPGEVIYLEGTALGPQTLVTASIDPATGKLANTIGNVSVTVGGFPAPMVYASATKVSAIVPYELKGFSTATVVLKYLGQTSNGITFGVATTAPGVFTANASGTGPAAAVNPDLTFNSPSTPAPKGSQIAVYITGEGETNPAGVTGKIIAANLSGVGPLTPVPLLTVTVLVDNQPAKAINYVGEVVGVVSGVLQVNFTLPDNVRSGEVPVVVSVGGTSSQPGVTVSVR